jgi:hypothetical protein
LTALRRSRNSVSEGWKITEAREDGVASVPDDDEIVNGGGEDGVGEEVTVSLVLISLVSRVGITRMALVGSSAGSGFISVSFTGGGRILGEISGVMLGASLPIECSSLPSRDLYFSNVIPKNIKATAATRTATLDRNKVIFTVFLPAMLSSGSVCSGGSDLSDMSSKSEASFLPCVSDDDSSQKGFCWKALKISRA